MEAHSELAHAVFIPQPESLYKGYSSRENNALSSTPRLRKLAFKKTNVQENTLTAICENKSSVFQLTFLEGLTVFNLPSCT